MPVAGGARTWRALLSTARWAEVVRDPDGAASIAWGGKEYAVGF